MPLLQTDAQCFIFCTGTMVIDIGIEGDMNVVFLIINHFNNETKILQGLFNVQETKWELDGRTNFRRNDRRTIQ